MENKKKPTRELCRSCLKRLTHLDEDGYPYNKELFNLYANSAMSMRCISSVTNISLTSIFNTLKNCREQLSDELREDIEDYNNGDFERI
jgi:transposase-like protein